MRLEKVPHSFAKLATLEKLWLNGYENLIESLMKFGNLRALDDLDLEDCLRLQKVPNSFAKLANFETI
jgi:Leucine-rich repeat (LRR) protein